MANQKTRKQDKVAVLQKIAKGEMSITDLAPGCVRFLVTGVDGIISLGNQVIEDIGAWINNNIRTKDTLIIIEPDDGCDAIQDSAQAAVCRSYNSDATNIKQIHGPKASAGAQVDIIEETAAKALPAPDETYVEYETVERSKTTGRIWRTGISDTVSTL